MRRQGRRARAAAGAASACGGGGENFRQHLPLSHALLRLLRSLDRANGKGRGTARVIYALTFSRGSYYQPRLKASAYITRAVPLPLPILFRRRTRGDRSIRRGGAAGKIHRRRLPSSPSSPPLRRRCLRRCRRAVASAAAPDHHARRSRASAAAPDHHTRAVASAAAPRHHTQPPARHHAVDLVGRHRRREPPPSLGEAAATFSRYIYIAI